MIKVVFEDLAIVYICMYLCRQAFEVDCSHEEPPRDEDVEVRVSGTQ